MKLKILKLFGLVLLFLPVITGNYLYAQVTVSEEEWVLPTYPVEAPDKNPIFLGNANYQGAQKHVYPLALNDVFSREKTEQAWKAVFLENEYIKLCVTPEIGGKLYYAEDKTNNYNFIYKNDVVKPAYIGMTGAWVSGGIEWCVFHHHRASTFLPVDYTIEENEDGSKTIWIGETEPRHRMRWTVGITLSPGKSYYEAEVRIHNPTPFTNTFLYWANVATHTNVNYQTIFPPSVQVATYHSKRSFSRWPVSTEVYEGNSTMDFTEGVDVSWWKNVVGANSFFAHDLKEDFMGGYDHGKQAGTVHIGDHNIVKGAKLWEWGSGPRAQATEARLTENAGPYVELMTGAFSDNQPDYSWIRPYEVKTFRQYWYPVRDIQGFKNANLNAAVNLEKREKNSIFLGYYSTQKVDNAKIILRNKDKILFEKNLMISPDKPFTETVKIDGEFEMTDLHTELINSETNEVLIEYQPVSLDPVDELPEIVKSPPPPKDIETVEELFLTGRRIEQFHHPRMDPSDYYNEALNRDPNDIRTNTAVGNSYLKNGDYATARSYFSKAIKRLTKDYTRPSSCEVLYLQGLALKALELYDEAVDTLYRATWDYAYHSAAYFELAQISVIRGDFEKALHQINESLSTNVRNNRAIALKAAIQRRQGDFGGAETTLQAVYQSDPLDLRIGNELYLIAKESGDDRRETDLLSVLTEKMRNFDQNYLEVSVGYLNDGLYAEAEDLLKRFNGDNPIVNYYLGYIYDKTGNRSQAEKMFKKASEQSTDYIFPFRFETIKVLETALKYNPKDAKAYYYTGNILYDKQSAKAIESWEKAVSYDPTLAIAYRNLGWGYYRHHKNELKAIEYYEKAIDLNKNEAIYYTELDALYERNNVPVETRLKLFDGNNEVVKKRDDAFIRQITVLNLAGQPEKSIEYLQGQEFTYREGSSRVREAIIDAHVLLGKKYLAEKNYDSALEHFLAARVPDEEAGSARFGNRDIQVKYYIGLAYEALGKKARANAFYKQAASEDSEESSGIMAYYQGLSYAKLGNKAKSKEIFNNMVSEGTRQIQQPADNSDFFAIFGEREAENTRKSQSYTLIGFGYKGLGQVSQAEESLKKAVELSYSNLWAKSELQYF